MRSICKTIYAYDYIELTGNSSKHLNPIPVEFLVYLDAEEGFEFHRKIMMICFLSRVKVGT